MSASSYLRGIALSQLSAHSRTPVRTMSAGSLRETEAGSKADGSRAVWKRASRSQRKFEHSSMLSNSLMTYLRDKQICSRKKKQAYLRSSKTSLLWLPFLARSCWGVVTTLPRRSALFGNGGVRETVGLETPRACAFIFAEKKKLAPRRVIPAVGELDTRDYIESCRRTTPFAAHPLFRYAWCYHTVSLV